MSDYNTSTTAYRNSADAHRGELGEWLGSVLDWRREIGNAVVDQGATAETLATEAERDGIWEGRGWYDRDEAIAALADMIAEAAAGDVAELLIEIADDLPESSPHSSVLTVTASFCHGMPSTQADQQECIAVAEDAALRSLKSDGVTPAEAARAYVTDAALPAAVAWERASDAASEAVRGLGFSDTQVEIEVVGI